MPIKNREDAVEVEDRIKSLFDAEPNKRASELRALFVEVLDFEPTLGQVPLTGGPKTADLPPAADRIASLEGVHVLYVALNPQDTDRVRKSEAAAAARLISDQLGYDLLLVFTNRSADQIHLILPSFETTRPTLRRMIIERDLPRRTAVQQVSNIYWNLTDGSSIREALKRAFDVEAVTREFFREYKQVFDRTLERVEGFGSSEEEKEGKKLFVQTLFNRLMFIYFLSRKGWLSFRGDKDYLNALRNDYLVEEDSDKNFYNDRLRRLFFNGLNNPLSVELRSSSDTRLVGPVPFLNGGLFDKTGDDKRSEVLVPDECIFEMFDKLFDKFNFTVMESTPFDIEVAVDPEMLGKVFEELVTGRHDSGSYYTPRPVVAFMCREAVKGFLQGRAPDLSPDAIAKFVDEHDASGIPIATAPSVGEALDEITVVDPACGSGAYLLGMMQELVELQAALYRVRIDNRSLYDLKLHIIQRNLHGVDNDEFAVNIAMLRMWLSLSIEYEGPTPEPLPNLDFKVILGDSLLGPDPSTGAVVQGALGRDMKQITLLGKLKAEYSRTSNGSEKGRLRRQIELIEGRVSAALGESGLMAGVVDWRVKFAEVFFQNGGFDVVLANPPYVVTKDAILRKMYKDGVYGRMNTYGLFIQRSLQLLCENGQQLFINPRTLLTDRYFSSLRKVINEKADLHGVVLIQDRHNTFARVLQECIILHLGKFGSTPNNTPIRTRSVWRPDDLNDTTAYYEVFPCRVLLGEDYDGSWYIGMSDEEYSVSERMFSVGKRLSDFGLKAETGKIQFDKYEFYAQPAMSGNACRLIWAENVQRYKSGIPRKDLAKNGCQTALVRSYHQISPERGS